MVLLIIVFVVLILLIAGDIFMGNALVSFAIQRTPQTGKTDVTSDAVISEETARIIEANKLSAAKTTNAWLAESFYFDPDAYFEKVFAFLDDSV